MLHKFLNDFLALAPLQLPELINQERMEQPVYEDGYVLLDFKLEKPCPLEGWWTCSKTRWNWSSFTTRWLPYIQSSDSSAVPSTLISGGCTRWMPVRMPMEMSTPSWWQSMSPWVHVRWLVPDMELQSGDRLLQNTSVTKGGHADVFHVTLRSIYERHAELQNIVDIIHKCHTWIDVGSSFHWKDTAVSRHGMVTDRLLSVYYPSDLSFQQWLCPWAKWHIPLLDIDRSAKILMRKDAGFKETPCFKCFDNGGCRATFHGCHLWNYWVGAIRRLLTVLHYILIYDIQDYLSFLPYVSFLGINDVLQERTIGWCRDFISAWCFS